MRTKIKRLVSIIVGLAILASILAGCGGALEATVTEATQAALQTPAATESATEPAAAEPAPVQTVDALPTYKDTTEIIRAKRLGLIPEGWEEDLSKEADFDGFDQMVRSFILLHNESYLEAWSEKVYANAYPDRMMRRDDGIILLFLTAETLGYNYGNFSHVDKFHETMLEEAVNFPDICMEFSMDYPYFDMERESGYYGPGPKNAGLTAASIPQTAYEWLWNRLDCENALYFLDHDGQYNFHFDKPLTREAAVTAMVRLYNSDDWGNPRPFTEAKYVALDDPAAVQPNSMVLTPELMEKAKQNPVITAEDHPRWTGFILGATHTHDTFAEEIAAIGEWNFNSVRFMMRYSTFFNEDVTSADLTKLRKLDQMVAAAIENDIHLNLCLCELPGRYTTIDSNYNQKGEFDLFINEEHQQKSDRVFRLLAARYRDVPNFNLSISPIWEANNRNLSTGLQGAEYTAEDIAAYLDHTIDVIREESPDRLVIYEPTASNPEEQIIEEATKIKQTADRKGNVIISYNACLNAYAYASMNHSPGRNIDDMNYSMFIPEYPNRIYHVMNHIEEGHPLTFDGVLPAGTQFTVYVWATGEGTLTVEADGIEIHLENLRNKNYKTSDPLSGYYTYATSKGKISFTLQEDAEEVVLSCEKGFINLSGICVTLPEEYAQSRWYYAQPYDVHLGKEEKEGVAQKNTSQILISTNFIDNADRVTIHEDLTYSTAHLEDEASLEVIDAWAKRIGEFDGNCVVRFERADMGGMIQGEMEEYYTDLLKTFEKYGYSWWSNDWWLMTDQYAQETKTAECESVEYAGYRHFNYDTLELLWQYRSKD